MQNQRENGIISYNRQSLEERGRGNEVGWGLDLSLEPLNLLGLLSDWPSLPPSLPTKLLTSFEDFCSLVPHPRTKENHLPRPNLFPIPTPPVASFPAWSEVRDH